MRNTIRSSDQLEAMSGQPVIGVVPEHGTAKPRALLDLAVDKPGSALIEAVRNLRSAIRLSNVDTTPTVIAVTSSLPDEGKSVLASLLSATVAGAGKRVLLIDTDLRRKVLREYFRSAHEPGLIGLLGGEATLEDVVHRDEQTGVDLILADSGQVNPADLFESRRFEQLITELRDEYDLIVLDTPPVLVVPDTRILCQYADAIVYCVRWNSTRKKMVEAGLTLLRQVQLQITGFALTRIDPKRMSHYGYYGYGSGRKKNEPVLRKLRHRGLGANTYYLRTHFRASDRLYRARH